MSLLESKINCCGYKDGFQLRDISFKIDEGEILVISGRSGSGKTTLVRAITGTLKAAGGFIDGKILLGGRDIESMNAEEVFRTMAYIPQEPWYAFIGHTVYAEICQFLSLAGVNCTNMNIIPFDVERLLGRLTYTLSAGEIQRVLWSESVLVNTKLMILDEPTVYLDREARNEVILFAKKALNLGVSILAVDHNPSFWEPLQPTLIYLEDGRLVYYGKWTQEVIKNLGVSEKRASRVSGDLFVQFENVWFKYPGGSFVLKNFSGSFNKGTFTCITGPNGSGKSTILKLAAGALKPSRGRITRRGSSIYIPENPLLYFTMPTPREELLASARGNENSVRDITDRFNLNKVLDKPLAKLSSGERRRLAIASAYLAGFEGYFIDEPTGGLDYDNCKEVLHALFDLVSEKKTVVVASHDDRIMSYVDYLIKLST
ncbi:MAG: ATP-binding cassette domain-containing protein [Desulfurococcaceae archaeon]